MEFSFSVAAHDAIAKAEYDPDGAAEALKLAAEYLRAGEPLPGNLAQWLAEAFEAVAAAPQKQRAAVLARGLSLMAGNRRPAADWFGVASSFQDALDAGRTQAEAALEAAFYHGVSESTAVRYWREYKKAIS